MVWAVLLAGDSPTIVHGHRVCHPTAPLYSSHLFFPSHTAIEPRHRHPASTMAVITRTPTGSISIRSVVDRQVSAAFELFNTPCQANGVAPDTDEMLRMTPRALTNRGANACETANIPKTLPSYTSLASCIGAWTKGLNNKAPALLTRTSRLPPVFYRTCLRHSTIDSRDATSRGSTSNPTLSGKARTLAGLRAVAKCESLAFRKL